MTKLTPLPGGVSHYTLLAECTAEAVASIPFCKEAPGVDRAKVHVQVAQMGFEFFESAWGRAKH